MASQSTIPDHMKCAQQNGYGNVRDVLSIVDNVKVPRELKSKQILIETYAISINPVDCKILNGNLKMIKRLSFPHIPGMDCSGRVVDIGSGVKRFKIGDSVYGDLLSADGGAFAEYICADESFFALMPKNLSYIEAAAVPLACVTSYQVLFQQEMKCQKGTKILICGGASATGLYAIQLAMSVGAQVTTTVSRRNMDLIKKLGYNVVEIVSTDTSYNENDLLVVDYTAHSVAIVLKNQPKFDMVYDCVGGHEQWENAQEIMRQGGCFITIVGDDQTNEMNLKSITCIATSLINRKFWSVFGTQRHSYVLHPIKPTPEDLDALRMIYIETGKLRPIIDTNYDGLNQLAEMYEKSKTGKAQGKLVLTIKKDNDNDKM